MTSHPYLQSNTSKNKVTQFAIDNALLGLRQLAPQIALLDALEGLIQWLALRQAQAEFHPFRLHLVYSSSEWLAVLDSLSIINNSPETSIVQLLLYLAAWSNDFALGVQTMTPCAGHTSDSSSRQNFKTSISIEQCLHLEMTDCSPGALDFVRKSLQWLHQPLPSWLHSFF